METEKEEAEKENMFELLKSASQRLTQTVLELEEVVSSSTNIKKEMQPLNLNDAITKTHEILKAQLIKEDVEFVSDIDASIKVHAAPSYLDSILLNFLTNGIKYRSKERKSFIKLQAAQVEDKISLIISDNGIGIDMEKNGDKLFGMYKTFNGNKDARGVGLFITRNQIESMGGTVKAESEKGVGTTFKITLLAAKE